MSPPSNRRRRRIAATEDGATRPVPSAPLTANLSAISAGPTTANTLSYAYVDNRTTPEKCKDDNDRIEEKCANNDKNAAELTKAHRVPPLTDRDAPMKTKLKYKADDNNRWMEKNCQGLWRKPAALVKKRRNTEDFREAIAINDVFVDGLRKLPAEQTKGFQITDELEAPGGVENVMATMMSDMAESNACIKARKCRLIPYSDVEDTKTGKGCCPGQTGHHVLPNAMFQNYSPVTKTTTTIRDNKTITTTKTTMEAQGLRKCWENYKEGSALTICLEGAGNKDGNGSHGRAHSETEKVIKKYRKKPDMKYTSARTRISIRISKLFNCDVKCIISQLDDKLKEFYSSNDECGTFPNDAKVTPHSGRPNGGPNVPEIFNPT